MSLAVLRCCRGALLLAAAGLVAVAPCGAGEKTSAKKVKVTASSSKPDASGKQTVTVSIEIEKGWHIYQNPVGSKALEANRTEVKFVSKGKLIEAKIEYPKGKKQDDYFVYQDKVTITAILTRPAGEPLFVEVSVSACSDGDDMVCLPEATVKAPVP